jgi:hypothetical protein
MYLRLKPKTQQNAIFNILDGVTQAINPGQPYAEHLNRRHASNRCYAKIRHDLNTYRL